MARARSASRAPRRPTRLSAPPTGRQPVIDLSPSISMVPAATTPRQRDQNRRTIWQAHQRYIEWHDTWRELGYVYEGDGPYLDGSALVAHPRELIYTNGADGQLNLDNPTGFMPKYKRRKALARYENFAQVVVDTVVDHQYAKAISRTIDTPYGLDRHPYLDWTDDVDGQGTSFDDWLKIAQMMACVYGKVWVVMDRLGFTAMDARSQLVAARRYGPGPGGLRRLSDSPPVSAADMGRLVLRTYTPLDVPDWLAPRNQVVAIKTVEAMERTDLMDPANLYTNLLAARDLQPQDLPEVEFRLWGAERVDVYDKDANLMRSWVHGFGRVPVAELYAKRRARIPVVGRSLLRDPRLYRDHFNLVSELRELLRSQTFSMLAVGLGDNEAPAEAQARLGAFPSTETVMFTRNGAEYVAPPDGPASTLMQEIANVERKIFRLAGLPWETDSAAPESADSRSIKASDLDRTLAGQADEAERFEYDIARLWFAGTFGADRGDYLFLNSGIQVNHPDEFNVEEVTTALQNASEALLIGLGATANARIRKQLLPIIIRNLTKDEQATMEKEIDDYSQFEAENKQAMDVATTQSLLADATANPEAAAGDVAASDSGGKGGGQ